MTTFQSAPWKKSMISTILLKLLTTSWTRILSKFKQLRQFKHLRQFKQLCQVQPNPSTGGQTGDQIVNHSTMLATTNTEELSALVAVKENSLVIVKMQKEN